MCRWKAGTWRTALEGALEEGTGGPGSLIPCRGAPVTAARFASERAFAGSLPPPRRHRPGSAPALRALSECSLPPRVRVRNALLAPLARSALRAVPPRHCGSRWRALPIEWNVPPHCGWGAACASGGVRAAGHRPLRVALAFGNDARVAARLDLAGFSPKKRVQRNFFSGNIKFFLTFQAIGVSLKLAYTFKLKALALNVIKILRNIFFESIKEISLI